MESFRLKTYLLYAIYIVRTHPAIIAFLAVVGLLNGITVYFPENSVAGLISNLTVISAIFISPVIYGIYYEVVEEKNSSITAIFQTYVGGYLLLLFCMYIPIVATTAFVLTTAQAEDNIGYVMLIILLFSLLFIYVVPTYYISGKILDSITFGVRFFFKHMLASAPVLLMALFSELLLLISHFQLGVIKDFSPSLFVFLDFSVYMVASIIDFLLFIMLVYIIKTEDISKR